MLDRLRVFSSRLVTCTTAALAVAASAVASLVAPAFAANLAAPRAATPAGVATIAQVATVPAVCYQHSLRTPAVFPLPSRARMLATYCSSLIAANTQFASHSRPLDRADWSGTPPFGESVLYPFTGGSDGCYPSGPLIQDAHGNLYGANFGSNACPADNGVIFKLTAPGPGHPTWAYSTIYAFPATGLAGLYPAGSLTMGPDGSIYGSAESGGTDITGCGYQGCGVIFKLTPPPSGQGEWAESVLYSFTFDGYPVGDNGDIPNGGLVVDKHGAVYGTALYGGPVFPATGTFDDGTVFKLTPPSAGGTPYNYSVVYDFTGANGDGYFPEFITADDRGHLFGTTLMGGLLTGPTPGCPHNSLSFGCGSVFELTPPASGQGPWAETKLYGFSGGADGNFPTGGLAIFHGALIGTTTYGGTNCPAVKGCGVAFALLPPKKGQSAWTDVTLYDFGATNTDADGPSPLSLSPFGLLGTSSAGGTTGSGTVFALTPAWGHSTWNNAILHNFTGGADGDDPNYGVLADWDGRLFGTTSTGGSPAGPTGNGIVFELKRERGGW